MIRDVEAARQLAVRFLQTGKITPEEADEGKKTGKGRKGKGGRAKKSGEAPKPQAQPAAPAAAQPREITPLRSPEEFAKALDGLKKQYDKLKPDDRPFVDGEANFTLALLDLAAPEVRAELVESLHNDGKRVGLLLAGGKRLTVDKSPFLKEALEDVASLRGLWAGLQMPVSGNFAGANTDESRLHFPGGVEIHSVGVGEIAAAFETQAQKKLFDRYDAFLRTAVASPAQEAQWPTAAKYRRGPWSLTTKGKSVTITCDGEGGKQKVTVNLSKAEPKVSFSGFDELVPRAFVYRALENLFLEEGSHRLSAREIRPEIAKVFNTLLGPDGVFSPADLAPEPYRFSQPMLWCWDYNGTVQGRDGMAETTRDLQRMGAESVLTTSMSPEGCEQSMEEGGIHFNAYFGGNQVRRGYGNKSYAPLAAAYGIKSSEVSDRMVVIGDQDTDGPGDLSDVLFLNIDSRTPAELLLSLVTLLEAKGRGSLKAGMDAVLDREGHFDLDGVSFDYAVRTTNPGVRVPTITNLKINPPPGLLVNYLTPEPGVDTPIGANHERMARRLGAGMTLSPAECRSAVEGLSRAGKTDLVAELGRPWLDRLSALEARQHEQCGDLKPNTSGFAREAEAVLRHPMSSAVWDAVAAAVKMNQDRVADPRRVMAQIEPWARETVELAGVASQAVQKWVKEQEAKEKKEEAEAAAVRAAEKAARPAGNEKWDLKRLKSALGGARKAKTPLKYLKAPLDCHPDWLEKKIEALKDLKDPEIGDQYLERFAEALNDVSPQGDQQENRWLLLYRACEKGQEYFSARRSDEAPATAKKAGGSEPWTVAKLMAKLEDRLEGRAAHFQRLLDSPMSGGAYALRSEVRELKTRCGREAAGQFLAWYSSRLEESEDEPENQWVDKGQLRQAVHELWDVLAGSMSKGSGGGRAKKKGKKDERPAMPHQLATILRAAARSPVRVTAADRKELQEALRTLANEPHGDALEFLTDLVDGMPAALEAADKSLKQDVVTAARLTELVAQTKDVAKASEADRATAEKAVVAIEDRLAREAAKAAEEAAQLAAERAALAAERAAEARRQAELKLGVIK